MEDYVKNEEATSMENTRMDKIFYYFTVFVVGAYFVNTFLCIIFTITAFALLHKLIGAIFLTITLCRITVCLASILINNKR